MFTTRNLSKIGRLARPLQTKLQKRSMGGGDRPPLTTNAWHTNGGIAMGFVCWMWVFYRAKHDLPVVLGLRHPWEHEHDDELHDDQAEDKHFEYLHATWDKHAADTLKVRDDDDDDDDEEDDDDE